MKRFELLPEAYREAVKRGDITEETAREYYELDPNPDPIMGGIPRPAREVYCDKFDLLYKHTRNITYELLIDPERKIWTRQYTASCIVDIETLLCERTKFDIELNDPLSKKIHEKLVKAGYHEPRSVNALRKYKKEIDKVVCDILYDLYD